MAANVTKRHFLTKITPKIESSFFFFFFWREKCRKKDRRSGHFGRFSTLQNSSKEPTRCAIFGSRASQTACSGRGFCFGSFLNSIRWHVWSGPMKRSSGMPLCPFFSNLHAIQPWRRACSLHLRSMVSSSCFIFRLLLELVSILYAFAAYDNTNYRATLPVSS